MMRFLLPAIAALAALASTAQAQQPAAPALTLQQKTALRCSVAFALVAEGSVRRVAA